MLLVVDATKGIQTQTAEVHNQRERERERERGRAGTRYARPLQMMCAD
jgi:hypothetical protein